MGANLPAAATQVLAPAIRADPMSQTPGGRVAVVTGGGSGIGQGIARHLAGAGHRVAVLDIDVPAAKAVATDLRGTGHQAMAAVADVSNRLSVEEALAQVRTTFGPIEILVTSAAITGFAAFV